VTVSWDDSATLVIGNIAHALGSVTNLSESCFIKVSEKELSLMALRMTGIDASDIWKN
jgi:hypothetical protein